MLRSNRIAFVSCACLLAACCLRAAIILPGDTVRVFLSSGAHLTQKPGSSVESWEGGTADLTYLHRFTDLVMSTISIAASNSENSLLLRQGTIAVSYTAFFARAGLFSEKIGRGRLYRERSIYNPLFDRGIVLDAYGFGGDITYHVGLFSCAAGMLGNARESFTLYAETGILRNAMKIGATANITSASVEDQDRHYGAGITFSDSLYRLSVNAALSYSHNTAAGRQMNPTLVPGDQAQGFLEVKVLFPRNIEVSTLLVGDAYKKRFDHTAWYWGADLEWIFSKYLGCGTAIELQKSDALTTTIPEFFFSFVPVKTFVQGRVYARRMVTGQSYPIYEIRGELCAQF